MALDTSKVRVAVTGALYWDLTGAGTAPTDTSTAPVVAYKDMGYVSEDGVTLTMPDSGDATPIKAWQNGATVRTVRAGSEDNPQLSLTLIETKLEVIQAVFGVTVTQTVAHGTFEVDTTDVRPYGRLILDVVDGAELIRVYGPKAIVSSVGEIALTSQDAIGYEVTIDLERDSAASYNFKSFMTALKT